MSYNPKDNEQLYRRNILICNFNFSEIDEQIKNEIEWHEAKLRALREQAGMFCYIYIPQTHPIVGHGLLKKMGEVEWENAPTRKNSQLQISNIEILSKEQIHEQIHHTIVADWKYQGEPYMKLTTLFKKQQPVTAIKGFEEVDYFAQHT